MARTFDRMSLECTTAAALASAVFGLYDDDGTGLPRTLVGSGFPAISGTSTGLKESVFSSPVALQPGLYWLAVLASGGTATWRALQGGIAPLPAQTGGQDALNGYELTGQLLLPALVLSTPTLISNAPTVALRAAPL
jgi:hypothetical protein